MLFILSAEVLSKALNSLVEDTQFVGYGLPKWSANLNHLAYADDAIIFASTNKYSLEKIMSILQKYEVQLGQKVNKNKSSYYLPQNAASNMKHLVEECTGFTRGHFPLIYLGCPITHARKRKEHYADLIKRVKTKLQA